VPRLCGLYPGICLTTEEKARKNLSQDSRRVPATKLQDVKSQSTVILTAVKITVILTAVKITVILTAVKITVILTAVKIAVILTAVKITVILTAVKITVILTAVKITVILTAVKIRINVKRKKMNCYLLARVIISRKSRQNKVRNYTIRTTMDVGKVVQGGSLPA